MRSNERTTQWFLEFLRWQYEYIFGDNQNGFDAFLKHSARESFVPELPNVTYALLDVENQVISAEGWYGERNNITLLHFWSSDYLMRDGTMEPKPDSLKKHHLFRIFFNGTDSEREEVLDILRYPRPEERNPCSVTSIGINELLNEHAPGVESMLPDFKELEQQRREAMEIRNERVAEEERKRELEELTTPFVEIMDTIGHMEDTALLDEANTRSLKKLCREANRGLLITFRAFKSRPLPRIARELEALLI